PPSSRAHQRPAPPRDGRQRLPTSDLRPRAGSESRPRSEGPVADTFMVNRPEAERLRLVETVIATAMADGNLAKIEERRIDQLVRILRLDSRSRQQIYATMRAGVMPELPTADELPDYDIRLHVFEQAAVMALADGVVHPDEQRHLRELAMLLELDIEDAKHALRRANFATGG
ncbi:MAG: TerB family tellurite resistance protein, partial [Deltaproteobacteria bacterium]